jgi:hypothetical protein
MPFEAVLERQAVLMSGACRLSLREVDCSAQAIEATETAALQRGAMLFAPELKVASATLGDDGRSVRPEEDSIGRALLGAVSPMVELVVQQCVNPGGCIIGAALPGKGALSGYLGADAESWGYLADGRIFNNSSAVQSGLLAAAFAVFAAAAVTLAAAAAVAAAAVAAAAVAAVTLAAAIALASVLAASPTTLTLRPIAVRPIAVRPIIKG